MNKTVLFCFCLLLLFSFDTVKKEQEFESHQGSPFTFHSRFQELADSKAIEKGELVFTANYGWVDSTHAFTDTKRNERYIGVEELWKQLKDVPFQNQIHLDYYSVNYKQDIVIGNYSIGIERQYLVKSGLNLNERKSIALAIFQDVSVAFEQMQTLHPMYGSAFEFADLPSNMLSFYRTVEGLSKDELKDLIQPLSPKQSLEVYHNNSKVFAESFYSTESFHPIYFKTPYSSKSFSIPNKLNTIKPASISYMTKFGQANLIALDQDLIKVRSKY